MIDIGNFHRDIRALLKQNKSGFVSPEDIDSFIYMASLDIIDEMVDDYRVNGQEFSGDSDILFLHSFSGEASERALPEDVRCIVGVFLGDNKGDLLDQSTFNDRLNSVIIPPTTTRPIATTYDNKIRIVPSASTHKIKYFRIPAKCEYAYTVNSSNNIIWNEGGSTDIDFPLSMQSVLLKRVLTFCTPLTNNINAGQLSAIK